MLTFRRQAFESQILFTVCLLMLFYTESFAAKGPLNACVGVLSSAADLGKAWQTAHWRNGVHPFRWYNAKALDRVMEDPDLAEAAQQWYVLNQRSTDRALMDQTYQFLVGLGDLRVKFDMPVGGIPNAPKPMLQYLKLVLSNAASGKVDVSQDVTLLTELNSTFYI